MVVLDLDAALVGAHSEKEGAGPTFKRGFGFHPILAFLDHGPCGSGEPVAAMLRPGSANANNAADQIAVLDAALAQLPEHVRGRVLVRGDSGSGVKDFVAHMNSGWSSRSGSAPANRSSMHSLCCPARPGAPLSTLTGNPARARRSPS